MAQMEPKDIIDKLQPNTYGVGHPIWERIEKGLSKLPKKVLNDLWIVVSCKREEE